MIGAYIVDRHSDLELLSYLSGTTGLCIERENNSRMPGLPVFIRTEGLRVVNSFFHTILSLVCIERLYAATHVYPVMQSRHLSVFGAFVQISVFFQHVLKRITMKIHAVSRISSVLVALKPITLQNRYTDLPNGIGHHKQIPGSQQRNRRRPHVSPYQSAHLSHGVRGYLNLVFQLVGG